MSNSNTATATIYCRTRINGWVDEYQITADCHESGEVRVSEWEHYRANAEAMIGAAVETDYIKHPTERGVYIAEGHIKMEGK